MARCRPSRLGAESSTPLRAEARTPTPCAPGRVARHDAEHERRGVAALLMAFDPVRLPA